MKSIFESSCFRCHGPEHPKSRFRLDNRESALEGGENNHDDIVPGNSAQSKLIQYVARLVEDKEMPPAGKGDPLTTNQIGLLRAWIDQGAAWPKGAETARRETRMSVTPVVQWIHVTGNKQKFREDWSQKEGFTSGYERFEMTEPVGKDAELKVEGRALFPQEDYRIALTLARPDLGFVRAGFDTYRKYFNDAGGSFSNQPPPTLNRDLYVNNGKAWFDLGLTLPNWPKLVLGYEYQFRDGNESTLQWGLNTNGTFKAVYPGYKDLNEHAHIFKLGLNHEVAGVSLEDNFRAEIYDLKTTRISQGDAYFFNPNSIGIYKETYRHFDAANAFRVEKPVAEWLLVSAGYLYSRLNGDGSISQVFDSVATPGALQAGDSSQSITLSQESHTINGNVRLGPWQGLTAAAGAQAEWQRRNGFSQADLRIPLPGSLANPFSGLSDTDRSAVDETFEVRYDRIPFTVLYGDARLQQERIDYYENGFVDDGFGDSRDFVRDTNARGDLKQYRAGFTISPWPRVSLDASFTHHDKRTDYDNRSDIDGSQPPFFFPGNGYPAFMLSRDIKNDSVTARLVLRPATWLKTTLKYEVTATDYHTSTESSTNVSLGAFFPGGEILAGNEDAHVYSINTTLTPWRRLNLSTTFSYSQSRLLTGVNDGAVVVPYRGDIYSVLSTATFIVSRSTDFHASYSFSRADYRQNNEASGLPLGIGYDRHAVTAGVTRRLLKNMTANVQYGYFRYDEPTSAGANNYRAHAVMASLNINLP
ncbi:MAG TPA: c-type cytochrome domain-containing protein [Candidatus Angelobacter sp.]|nr:c-type cytochrome domain-containing protein [Candidatus Angelobacter sp.]